MILFGKYALIKAANHIIIVKGGFQSGFLRKALLYLKQYGEEKSCQLNY